MCETIIMKCSECGDRFYIPKPIYQEHDGVVECDCCGGDCHEDDDQSIIKHQATCNLHGGFR